jgi:hypothetical protein
MAHPPCTCLKYTISPALDFKIMAYKLEVSLRLVTFRRKANDHGSFTELFEQRKLQKEH